MLWDVLQGGNCVEPTQLFVSIYSSEMLPGLGFAARTSKGGEGTVDDDGSDETKQAMS